MEKLEKLDVLIFGNVWSPICEAWGQVGKLKSGKARAVAGTTPFALLYMANYPKYP